jgi:hypothetical protein
MNEAQGEAGKAKLPQCRGRHPDLDAFEPHGCPNETKLILVGASNLWFPATQSIIVMPESSEERTNDLADQIRLALGEKLAKYYDNLDFLRELLDGKVDVAGLTDDQLSQAVTIASAPPESAEERPNTTAPCWPLPDHQGRNFGNSASSLGNGGSDHLWKAST